MGSSGFSWKLADHPPKSKVVAMVVLDGWGEADVDQYNCIHVAETPTMDSLKNVIVEKAERSDIPNIDKKKYLVPADLTVGQFVYVFRKRIKLSAEKAIFIFVDNVLPPTEQLCLQYMKRRRMKMDFCMLCTAERTHSGIRFHCSL